MTYVWWYYSDSGVCFETYIGQVECDRLPLTVVPIVFLAITVLSLRVLAFFFVPELGADHRGAIVPNQTNPTNRRNP